MAANLLALCVFDKHLLAPWTSGLERGLRERGEDRAVGGVRGLSFVAKQI